jgi:hypothetical protein
MSAIQKRQSLQGETAICLIKSDFLIIVAEMQIPEIS